MDVIRNAASLTVTSTSATTSPAAGTVETWTVAALPASFGVALAAGETLRLVNCTFGASLAQQSEITLLTAMTGTGATSITVTRGVESTTPVVHAAGSTFAAVVTKATLDNLGAAVVPVGGTTGQVLAKVTGADYNTAWTTSSGGGGGGGWTRTTVAVTTASLANGASADVTLGLPAGYRVYRVVTDRAARGQCYTTSAKRTADAGRAIGTDPTGDHGLVLDYVTTTGVLSVDLSPLVDGFDGAATPAGAVAGRVTNLGTTGTVTLTLTYIRTE